MKKSEALELFIALALEQMDDMKELAKNDPDCDATYKHNVAEMEKAKPIINELFRKLEKNEET